MSRLKLHQLDSGGATDEQMMAYDTTTGVWRPVTPAPSGISIQDENAAVASGVTTVDFQGAGVTATDVGSGEVIVTIGGGGGGGSAQVSRAERTSGNVSFTSTSFAAVDTGLDLLLVGVVAGMWIRYTLSSRVQNEANTLNMDVATVVGGSVVNYFSSRTNTPASGGLNAALTISSEWLPNSGSFLYQIQASDISSGSVTLRLMAKATNASPARVILASTASPLQVWAEVAGGAGSTIIGAEVDLSSTVAASTGWTVQSCKAYVLDRMMTVSAEVTRTGADITVGSGGNITPDVPILTGVPAAYRPDSTGALGTAHRGGVQTGWVNLATDGTINFTDGLPSVTYAGSSTAYRIRVTFVKESGGAGVLAGRDRRWVIGTGATAVDEFNDDTLDAAWTRMDGTGAVVGNLAWTESADVLSAKSIAAADTKYHSIVKAIGTSMVVGDGFITAMRVFSHYNITTYSSISGLYLSTSATYNSGEQVGGIIYYDPTSDQWVGETFGMTANAGNADTTLIRLGIANMGLHYVRLVYVATNTWRCDVSPDGVSWITGTNLSKTMTPTHVGFCVSNQSALQAVSSFEFLRRVSGVT